jgi:DNA modification methylase
LDPFVGGGTTAVVALRLERRFVGIDKDVQAIETTRGRIAEVFECQMLDQSERVGATLH